MYLQEGVLCSVCFLSRFLRGSNINKKRGKMNKIMYVQGLRMGRAGQHFKLFDAILGGVKKVTTHNHSLRVQYVR